MPQTHADITPNGGSQSPSWQQTFKFDRYGNRNFNESLTTTLPKGCMDDNTPVVCEADKKRLNPALNASDNKISSGQDWSYDAAGNVIGDPQGRAFFYDAENKQVEVKNSSDVTVGKYWFDGDGKRIKKDGIAPNGQPELTVFVYDAGGKLIGEYSTNVETAAPKVQYLTADHLGSPRINTDQNGTVTSRTDYMPYGEEIIALGGRSANENYITDDIRKGFTDYEKDAETGLDYAIARFYKSANGRFLAADPALGSALPAWPQTFNKYTYVTNNPLVFTDPYGLYICQGLTDQCKQFEVGLEAARTNLEQIKKDYGVDSEQYLAASRALSSYGAPGEDNKVLVKFGTVVGASATVSGKPDENGNTVVTFDLVNLAGSADEMTGSSLNSFQALIGHEGAHVSQQRSGGANGMSTYDREFAGLYV